MGTAAFLVALLGGAAGTVVQFLFGWVGAGPIFAIAAVAAYFTKIYPPE